MWALPTLSSLDAESLPGRLDGYSLWCLLLFPRAERSILEGLRQNWDRFSQALGHNVHVITLLDSADPNSARGLKFPANYEAQVGRFCHDLHIRLDHLPAIFLLNASDGRGEPYWSLRRESPRLGSAALETLVSDICSATHNLPEGLDAVAWRNAAATKLLNARSAREALNFVRAHPRLLMSTIQRLLRGPF
jgi:hypothetical protein